MKERLEWASERWRADIEKGIMPVSIHKTFIPEKMDTTDGDVRKAAFVVSTGDEDRDGDVVSPSGWDLEDYRKNPVVLWAHDLKSLPIAKAESILVHDGKLKAVTAFPEKGVYPFADTVYGLLKGGFIRGTSVGFHPLEASPRKGREKGVNFTRQSLYEFSILPIPSNRNALAEAKSAGYEVGEVVKWAESFLEKAVAEGIWIPKIAIEKAIQAVLPLQVSVPAMPLEEVKTAPEGHAVAGADSWATSIVEIVEKAAPMDMGGPTVKQEGAKWCVYGADGKKLGEYASKAEAMAAMPGMKSAAPDVVKYITEENGTYLVHAESGKVLGKHKTRADAVNQLQAIEAAKHARPKGTLKEDDMDIIKGIADELFSDQSKGTPPWLKEGQKDAPPAEPAADAEPDPGDKQEPAEQAAGEPPEQGQDKGAPPAQADQLFATLTSEIEPLKQGGDPTQIAQALKAALEKFAAAFMMQYANPANAGLPPAQATPPPPPAAKPAAAPPPPAATPDQRKGFTLDGAFLAEDDIRETIQKAVRQNMDEARMRLTGKLPG